MVGARRAQHFQHDAGGLLRKLLLARGDAHKGVGLEIKSRGQLVLALGKELRHAAGKLAVLVHLKPVGLRARLNLHIGAELVDMLSRQLAVGYGDRLHNSALGVERGKLRAAGEDGNILHVQVDAKIRLIRAVALHGFHIADALERRVGRDVISAEFCEYRGQHVLQHGKNVLLRGERHLHIQLIEFARGAVAARVLIAEARCDLEITVKPGGHEKLLELLGRLRQGIKLAGVFSCRNKIVARALRGGCGENGGGYLKKAVRRHRLAQRRNDVAAEDDVLFDGRVSQIEIAVFQSRALVRLAAAVYFKRQLIVAAFAEYFYLLRHDLNVAGVLLRVFTRALAHNALHGNGGLLVDGLDDLHHVLRLHDHLRRAVKVAQDDKRKIAADLADILHPADKLDLFAHIAEPQLIAGMCTGLKHKFPSLLSQK